MLSAVLVVFILGIVYMTVGVWWANHFYWQMNEEFRHWIVWHWACDLKLRIDNYIEPVTDYLDDKIEEVKAMIKEKFHGRR